MPSTWNTSPTVFSRTSNTGVLLDRGRVPHAQRPFGRHTLPALPRPRGTNEIRSIPKKLTLGRALIVLEPYVLKQSKVHESLSRERRLSRPRCGWPWVHRALFRS